MNETRTTRIIALIAGNGYFLNKIGEYWLGRGGTTHFLISVVILSIIALIGIIAAYISLLGRHEKRWPFVLELVSAFGFLINALWWLYVIIV
jgi:hypothetical protein